MKFQHRHRLVTTVLIDKQFSKQKHRRLFYWTNSKTRIKNKVMIEKHFIRSMAGRELSKQEGSFSLLALTCFLPGVFSPYISKYYPNFDFQSLFFITRENHGVIWFILEHYKHCTATVYQNLLQTQINEDIAEYMDFKKAWERVEELLGKTSPDRLRCESEKEVLQKAQEAFHLLAILFASTIFTESLDEEMVRSYYSDIDTNQNNFEEFFTAGAKVTFESFAVRIDKVLLKYQDLSDISDIQWLLTDYGSAPFIRNIDRLVKDLVESKGGYENIKKELKRIGKELSQNQKFVDSYRLSLSDDEARLLDFMQLCMKVRDIRKEPMQKILASIANTTRDIFRRHGLDEEDVVYSIASDFYDRKFEEKNYKEEITRRKKNGTAGYYDANGCQLEYENLEQIRKDVYSMMDGTSGDNANEVKGTIGCKGFVRAPVCVIAGQADFAKFKDGCVLVTSMTRPEFVPLMKRSSAVVTDEGGITCHAAIVSRELNIPCIIGTKFATRVLKDGDMVEVDAGQGIIKKI